MIIEIGYTYQSDKSDPAETSWTYFYVKADEFNDSVKKKATRYWKKWVDNLEWQKKVKLIHIEEIPNGKTYTPEHIIVSADELTPARKRRSTPQQPTKQARSRKSITPAKTKQ